MVIAIHQPNFLPNLNYFRKMYRCDVFVLLTDVYYSKNSFINRNIIRTKTGNEWLTVPIKRPDLTDRINEVELFQWELHSKKILATIKGSYAKCKNFNTVYYALSVILDRNYVYLVDLNVALIEYVKEMFGFDKNIYDSATFDVGGYNNQKLINIIRELGGKSYLHGTGCKSYQDKHLFELAGIELIENNTEPFMYKHRYGEFDPNLSIIDFLMNYDGDYKDAIR